MIARVDTILHGQETPVPPADRRLDDTDPGSSETKGSYPLNIHKFHAFTAPTHREGKRCSPSP